MRYFLTVAVALFLLIPISTFAECLPGKGKVIYPVQSPIAEESFQTLLVSRALEKLGYTVSKPKEIDYSMAYAAVASGVATFLASNWHPMHNEMYESAGGDKKVFRQGALIEGAAQGYLIDKRTADLYHISHISQLSNPRIARLFDSNNDGRADLVGCNPGWQCESAINQHIHAYGLEKTVIQNQGNYAAIISDTISRYKEGKPIIYYTWTPYWVSNVLKPGKDVVWLQVPFSPISNDQTDTQLPNGDNYGFPESTVHIIANKNWIRSNPAAKKLFSIMKLPINDINAQNAVMHKYRSSERDIQNHVTCWIKARQAMFDYWIQKSLAVSVKK